LAIVAIPTVQIHGCAASTRDRRNPIGFDYVHAAVDDHTRLAYAEVHPDEKGTMAAEFPPGLPPTSPSTA